MGRNVVDFMANIIAAIVGAKNFLPLQIVLLLIFSTSAGAATLKFEYDQAGNMISGQGRYYEYNDANQLVKVRKDSPSGPVIAEYVYDYQGQRVKKIENGITTYYIGKHYEERKGNTVNEKTNYIFVNGHRVAATIKKDNEPAKVSYYLNNHLGSADVVVDEQGNVTDKVRCYPYGEYRTQPNAQRHTYTGKERDEATEQYYYEARYYNPFIRRFTQADTVTPNLYDPQSLNRYAYVRNNPLVYTDPSGHLFWDVIDVISFAQSAYSFATDPTWENAAWLAADTVGLLPGLPGASTVKIGVAGAGAIVSAAKTIDKAAEVATIASKVERTSDVVNIGVKSGNLPVLYDAKFAATQLLDQGSISLDRAKSFVPKDATGVFRKTERIDYGQQYNFIVNNEKVTFRFHSPDSGAFAKYPGSNSGSFYTGQVKVGNELLGSDGRWYSNNRNNVVHIPLKEF